MNQINFYKYQGCGNDFILIDNRSSKYIFSREYIYNLCHRRFGIGADGLMLLENDSDTSFSMKYYNSDGNESSFCGNGGRCIVQFAKDIGVIDSQSCQFRFNKNIYQAEIYDNSIISLKMQDVEVIAQRGEDLYFCTGSPHYVHFTENIDDFPLISFAREIRYSDEFPKGINVNIVEKIDENILKMRTYERGVEDETYSCGTGVTAAAIAYHQKTLHHFPNTCIKTKGGDFTVGFTYNQGKYSDVKLNGSAKLVFKGSVDDL